MSKEDWLVDVSWAGGYLFVGSDTGGHSLVFDSDNPRQRGVSPMRTLLASLGACTGMDIVAILGKRKQKLESLRVLLRGSQPEHGYPKPWRTIEMKYVLAGDLDEKSVREAVEESIAKFCSVAATLSPDVKLTHSYEIVR